jgi:hypothetical protein
MVAHDFQHNQCALVFCDTFTHSTVAEHVDCITFAYPIIIKQFRVVAKNQNPHPRKLNFYGRTQPKSFWITVFSKQQALPEDGWHARSQENGPQPQDYFSFSPVADPFPYKEAIEDTFVPLKECVTDTISIRGSYHALSLCIYGLIYNPTTHSPLASSIFSHDSFGTNPIYKCISQIDLWYSVYNGR